MKRMTLWQGKLYAPEKHHGRNHAGCLWIVLIPLSLRATNKELGRRFFPSSFFFSWSRNYAKGRENRIRCLSPLSYCAAYSPPGGIFQRIMHPVGEKDQQTCQPKAGGMKAYDITTTA